LVKIYYSISSARIEFSRGLCRIFCWDMILQ
jgi:hypothetical protein